MNAPQSASANRTSTTETVRLDGPSNSLQTRRGGRGATGHEPHGEESNDHLALIYESQEGQFASIAPFIKQGLEQGERCLYIADDNAEEEVLEALRDGGIDVDAAIETGALSIYTKDETYLQGGEFDTDQMLQFWQESLADAQNNKGFTGIRATAEMTWALEGDTGLGELVRYEALLNTLYEGEEYVVLCQYNRERFPSEVLSDVIRSHPLVVKEGTVCENPYYQRPSEFLGGGREGLDVDQVMEELGSRAHTHGGRQEGYRVELGEITSNSDLTFKEKVEGLLDLGRERFGLDMGFLLEKDGESFRVVKTRGTDLEEGRARLSANSGQYCKQTIVAEEPVGVEDVEAAGWDKDPLHRKHDLGCYLGTRVKSGRSVYGILCFAGTSAREWEFTEAERAFLDLMGQWVSNEISRKKRQEHLRELTEITTTSSSLSFEEKLQDLFELGCEWFGMDFGALNRVDPEADRLQVEYVSGEHPYYKPGFELPLSQTYCQAAADLKEAASVSDPKEEGYEGTTVYKEFGVEGYFGTYVSVEGGPDRTLAFLPSNSQDGSSKEEPFSEEEESYLELMGQWVKYELERQESSRALRESKDRLATKLADMQRLHALSTRLLEEEDVESVLHEVMAASAELLGAEKASVQIYDDQEEVLRLVSALGFDQSFFEKFEEVRPEDVTTCAASLEQGGRVLVEDLSSNPEFAEFARAVAPYGVEAALSTPLYGSEGQLFGIFTMCWEAPHRPSEEEFRLLDLYTQQAARQIERKRAEAKIHEHEQHLNAIIETAPECIKVIAEDGTLLEMNPAGLDMVEADSASRVVGDSVYDLIAPEDRQKFRAFNERICRGESETMQFDIISLEGTRRHMESHAAPLRLSDGESVQLALTKDITERKRNEEALRESKRRLSLATDAAELGVFTWDVPNDQVSWENERMYEIFGRSPEEGTINAATFANEVFHPDDAEEFEAAVEKGLQTGQFHFVGRFFRGDGELRWIEFTGQVQHSPNGTPAKMYGIAADITEQKQTEEWLHDLNETLEERVEKRTRQVRELTSKVTMAEQRERERIARVLHDDLQHQLYGTWLKMEPIRETLLHGGQKGVAKQVENVEEKLQAVLQAMRQLAVELSPPVLEGEGLTAALEWLGSHMEETKGLEVDLAADGEHPMEKELRVLLFRVTRELLSNVSNHAGVGRATVELTEEGGERIIRVADEGEGFDPAALDELSPEEGFGLRAAGERVRQFGGELLVRSAPGEGTEVTIHVPIEEDVEPGG